MTARLPVLRKTAPLALAGLLMLSGCGVFNAINPFGGPSGPKPPELSQMSAEDLYNAGIEKLRAGQYEKAVQFFDGVQQYYPYSPWTSNAQLMEGYANYQDDSYADAITQLDHYKSLHPTSPEAPYAFYLRALCFYEQIADIQRDQRGTVQAMAALQEVVSRYPDTPYARDAALKIDLCRDHLAGKEMLIGRYYERQHLYEAAINRYQRVVQDYQTTNHVAEALERLTECYLKLGLVDQARKTASVLAYNYPGSTWYQDSYRQLQQAHGEAGVPKPKGSAFLGIF
jgi:outer membrane protein assembly factor BamD